MRYHLFLQYGWFLQNLGKDFIRTNMHTIVAQFSNRAKSGIVLIEFVLKTGDPQ